MSQADSTSTTDTGAGNAPPSGATNPAQPAPSPPGGSSAPPPAEGDAGSSPLSPFLKDGKIFGKFDYNPDDPASALATVAKSYSELEKAKSSGPKPRSNDGKFQPKAPETGVAISDIPDDATVSQIVESAGLSPLELVETFKSQGKLTDDMYAALKSKGYPKGVVDTYMKAEALAHSASRQQVQQELAQMAGGGEQMQTMLAWASSLPDDTKTTINGLLAKGATAKMGMKLLMAEYAEQAGDRGGNYIDPSSNSAAGGGDGPFTTVHERDAARKAAIERYGPDPFADPSFARRFQKSPHHIQTGY